MTKLEQYLNNASRAYYTGAPIISDAQFDQLADSCGYSALGAAETGKTEKHFTQMYSLQKYYEDQNKVRPLKDIRNISASIKLDGAAISLLYLDGVLVRALTRGDGVEGQLVTDKILSSNSLVPHNIDYKGVLQVTGEIVAPSHIPNARNYAAGALNLKNNDEFSTRALSFFAYSVSPTLYDTYDEDMGYLAKMGFNNVQELDLEKVYPSDGMVFRVNSNKEFLSMGYTAKHPRGAYALKIRAEHVETTLLDVEWQVGKSGKVTPVAILEPVYIGDALVSRATLNNPGFIEALGIEIGDTLAIIRAGEIIPCVLHKVEA
jgi:NAD-dependent DNA ligase